MRQSADTVSGIVLASSLIPAFTFFVGVAALFFYPISKKFNIEIQNELARRREIKEE